MTSSELARRHAELLEEFETLAAKHEQIEREVPNDATHRDHLKRIQAFRARLHEYIGQRGTVWPRLLMHFGPFTLASHAGEPSKRAI